MIVKAGGGWQTILADLALILFMVSVSAASTALDAAARRAASPSLSPSMSPPPRRAAAVADEVYKRNQHTALQSRGRCRLPHGAQEKPVAAAGQRT